MHTKYIAFAIAKEGCLLPGAVKRWESSPQDTRQLAKDVLAGFIDGHETKTSCTGTREIKCTSQP